MIKKILIVSVSLMIFCYCASLLYVGLNVYKDTKQKADAIVVLGARGRIGENFNPCVVERVKHAVSLYKDDYSDTLIVSGGGDAESNDNEALIMKQIAIENGVLEEDIFLEDTSTSTYENIVNTKEKYLKDSNDSIILVSDPYHLPRASLVASNLMVHNMVSPALTSPCWTQGTFFSPYFFREGVALLNYIFTGKI